MLKSNKPLELAQKDEIFSKISSASVQTADTNFQEYMEQLTDSEIDNVPVRMKSKSGNLIPYFITAEDQFLRLWTHGKKESIIHSVE